MTANKPRPPKRIPVCLLAVIAAIFSGCHREPPRAETEQQILATTFRYYYDRDLLTQMRGLAPKVVFVGVPSVNWAGSPVIERSRLWEERFIGLARKQQNGQRQ